MGRQLTVEQAEIAAERKMKKAANKAAAFRENFAATMNSGGQNGSGSQTGKILERSWIRIRDRDEARASFKLMTWNLLAQTLVRE